MIGGKSPGRLAETLKLKHARTRWLGADIVVEGDLRSWLAAIGVLVLALGLEPSLTMARVDPPQSLSSLVFQYLDSADSEEAERFLELLLNHPDTSVERVTRIIETERTYDAQPIGTIANEGVELRAKSTRSPCRFH